MIEIQQNKRDYEYDIYSLVKAFYPKEEVNTYIDGDNREKKDTPGTFIRVRYEESDVTVSISEPGMDIFMEEKRAVPFENRVQAKNVLKHLLYGLLSAHTGRTLPWGTLTGIRPTKIPVGMLEEGHAEEEVRAYMKKTYLADEDKIDLSLAIARKEIQILKDIDYKNGYSVYVGIPFCPTTCLYCSFTSYPIGKWQARVDEYMDALCREIRFTAEAMKDKHLNTVYIGGGTPTTLTPEQLDRLLTVLHESFDYTWLKELTVEAGRPDSVTKEKLQVLKKHQVSRISINPQTMNQKTLDLIGRHHSVEQIREVYAMARRLGFDNINMDLIVGLPEEELSDVRRTMEEVALMAPDSITVHSLAVKRAARLHIFREEYENLSIYSTREMIDLTASYAEQAGTEPYYLYRQKNMAGNFENVGYAKPGKEGIYNILIMEEKQTIMALGAGASSKMVFPDGFRIERIENVKDVEQYITRIDEMIGRKQKFLSSNVI